MFSGHEHNFQHSRHEGIDYFVTGGGGRTRDQAPDSFELAHTKSWSSACHFLLVAIEGDRMTVRAIGEGVADESALSDIVRIGRDGTEAAEPMLVRRDQS